MMRLDALSQGLSDADEHARRLLTDLSHYIQVGQPDRASLLARALRDLCAAVHAERLRESETR